MKNTTLVAILVCIAVGLYTSCVDTLPDSLCGDALSDLSITSLPDVSSFAVVAADTAADSVTIRYTSPSLVNVCPLVDVGMQVRAVGAFSNVGASLWWTSTDKTDFALTRQDSTWTGASSKVDISPVYGDGAGTLWVTVDFTFPYAGNDTSVAAVYQELGNLFEGLYFKPDAFRLNP